MAKTATEQAVAAMLEVLKQQGDEPVEATGKKKGVKIASVQRHEGAGISIPAGVTIPDAIKSLQQQMEYEEKDVTVVEDIPVLVYDGCAILNEVLKERFGNAAMGVATRTMFGDNPPALVSVRCGHRIEDVVQVPWGEISLVGVHGTMKTSYTHQGDGSIIFRLMATVKRKDEKLIRDIVKDVRARVETDSIYRGKALRIKFRDGDGDIKMEPNITFMDTAAIRDADLVYSAAVRRQVETSIFTPIEAAKTLRELGVPPKRGVLLHGPFGTGKTLAAYGAAKRAVEARMTFLYLEDASELADAMNFAKNYGPCVIFAEDIDRQVAGEERTTQIDNILNCLDGVDTKGSELLVVFTTNNISAINSAMMRPGRLDAVIHVTAPDAEAASTLVVNYSRGMLAADIDMVAVGEATKGLIPAVIREAVERAKLFSVNEAIRSGKKIVGGKVSITTQSLIDATAEVKKQTALATRTKRALTAGEQISSGLERIINNGEGTIMNEDRDFDADSEAQDDFVDSVLNS